MEKYKSTLVEKSTIVISVRVEKLIIVISTKVEKSPFLFIYFGG
jgi:hypothetical protein